MTRWRLALATAAALTTFLAAAPTLATFTGSNGRIAFSQGDLFPGGDLSAHSQVFTIRPGGGGLAQLTHVGAHHAAAAPDWSPDGERIAYESNQSGHFRIWVMKANGSAQTRLTHKSGFEDFLPSWSPNGKRLVFSHCGEPAGFIAFCDIATVKADGTGFKTLLSSGQWTNVRPVYSPSGKRIAFGSDKGGRQSSIWVMHADGSSPKRITAASLRAFWPDWSPDGKRILFSDNCCLPHSNLWTVRPDGTELRQLTHVPQRYDAAFGSFSPNGARIVLHYSKGCGGCFYTLGANGSRFNKVATGKPNTFLTDWGPKN